MAMEILDGSIDPAQPVRAKGKFAMFKTLHFRDRSGASREIANVCTGGEVSDAIRKGGSGKFYLSSGGGQTGIHGVRLDDGTKAYAHYNNMEFIVLLGIAAGVAAFAFSTATGSMMITPLVIAVLLVAAYVFLRSVRVAGKRQYDADQR
jgi:hypothetical protein